MKVQPIEQHQVGDYWVFTLSWPGQNVPRGSVDFLESVPKVSTEEGEFTVIGRECALLPDDLPISKGEQIAIAVRPCS